MVWIHQVLVTLTKVVSHLFFRCHVTWVPPTPADPWREDIRLVVLLNHTSLFEPLYLAVFPFRFLWRVVPRAVIDRKSVV